MHMIYTHLDLHSRDSILRRLRWLLNPCAYVQCLRWHYGIAEAAYRDVMFRGNWPGSFLGNDAL